MNWHEKALRFECDGEYLIGVASLPDTANRLGVVIVVGGPQYRAGSHRQFVSSARCFAEAGYSVLRFDYRGMGDSPGSRRSFETVSSDIGAAIDTLLATAPGVREVVLWGLCDGASAALLYVYDHPGDTRVAGLCLLNPWVRTESSLAKTHIKHYYFRRLREPDFWRKLLRGKVALEALGELMRNFKLMMPSRLHRGSDGGAWRPTYTQKMARAWLKFKGRILLITSGRDYTAMEFLQSLQSDPDWRHARGHLGFEHCTLPEADHTFSSAADRHDMEGRCVQWLMTLLKTGCGAGDVHTASIIRTRA